MKTRYATLDGNEAAARIAHLTNEVIAIYPITPASAMGELSDAWSAAERRNLWGIVPEVIEMQSEGGAAGALHGALQAGSLATTFTASQGLLLMIPNMYKIAGELTPTVIHVAARSIATHALSIFGDHSDVMGARQTGWAMLCSSSVQESHDFALISQMATLKSRIPFLHFFDGFRTSHEVNRIAVIDGDHVRRLIDDKLIHEHRARSLDPAAPVLRGTAQNPDVFFQAREGCNRYYDDVHKIVESAFTAFADACGRQYHAFEYIGAPDAERVIVMMGSGIGAAEEAVSALTASGEKVGLVKVRLYRPFDVNAFISVLPETTQRLAILDRTKEPGAPAEPLHLDVMAALELGWAKGHQTPRPQTFGGRYGLSSKEFTPAMVKAVFDVAGTENPPHPFTVGIHDDVTHLSLEWDPDFRTEPDDVKRAVFFGLGSDGTVGANKNTIKIIGEGTDLHAQGYFVYDSKKSGSVTVSHVRFGPRDIQSTYLIQDADLVACHHQSLLERLDVLGVARKGSIFLLNSPHPTDAVWGSLPKEVQTQIIEKELEFWIVDAGKVASEAGLGNRINTVMQTCFFALGNVLPIDEAIERIEDAIKKTYGRRGDTVVARNLDAVSRSRAALVQLQVPTEATSTHCIPQVVPSEAPDFVQRVTSMMLAGRGDLLPVSALPVDGTFPTATSKWEKRGISRQVPIWDADICTQCGLCPLVCPHACIRMKVMDPEVADTAPDGFITLPFKGKEYQNGATPRMTIQVSPDDCTGCSVCANVCPARDRSNSAHKALDMVDRDTCADTQRDHWKYFESIPEPDRANVNKASIKGSQMLDPLFEFSGACAGCGETPYIKLLTQLFGDRLMIANATGCSSIYGGNLPTTPYTTRPDGCGPAWANSLFEDNAEFGLGMRLASDSKHEMARKLVESMRGVIGDDLAKTILAADQEEDTDVEAQRGRVRDLVARLDGNNDDDANALRALSSSLVRQSVWIVGGDGWAYDIGFGGLDHVLSSGRDVNVLVLDTEVYSNTGGQASKATFRAATAKFAAGGKTVPKKDLGMTAMAYGDVFVASIAMGAKPQHTINALLEAERHPGPSLVIAYSPCIAHGIDMSKMIEQQKAAVSCGYWPLYRFMPDDPDGASFKLDSRKPRGSFQDFAASEARFAMLMRSRPKHAQKLLDAAQRDITTRYRRYEHLSDEGKN